MVRCGTMLLDTTWQGEKTFLVAGQFPGHQGAGGGEGDVPHLLDMGHHHPHPLGGTLQHRHHHHLDGVELGGGWAQPGPHGGGHCLGVPALSLIHI